jgi:hypothetical protein
MPAPVKSHDPSKLWCSGCQQFLPFDSFWPDKHAGAYRVGPDGVRRSARCKECRNKEYIKIDSRKKLLYNANNRAKDRGFDCDLTVDDIVIPEFCPVLGIPLQATVGQGRVSMKDNWNAPTLDRIDSAGGYTKGNVMVISARANFLKNDATLEEMRAILRYMESHQPKP